MGRPVYNVEYNTKDYPTVYISNLGELLGDPIIVGASFGVNGVNSYKGGEK